MPARRGELKYLIVTHSPDGEHLVRFVLRSDRHLAELRTALPRLLADLPSVRVVTANLHPEHKAVLEGETEVPLTGQTLLPMRVGDATLLLGPRSFFQTNTTVAAALYRQARDWVDAADPTTVWDLYCGVGGFARHVTAPGRTVVGVETSVDAVDAARAAARVPADAAVPASAPAPTFVVGDATTVRLSPAPDLVVVNPPRRGIGPDLAAWLDASPATDVLYSSCNVDSLARDLANDAVAAPGRRSGLRHVPADPAHRGDGAARARAESIAAATVGRWWTRATGTSRPSRLAGQAAPTGAHPLVRGAVVGGRARRGRHAVGPQRAVPAGARPRGPCGRRRPADRAVVVGAGLGADAELLASRGYRTVAFDLAPSAVELARSRYPGTAVDYRVADLLDLPPTSWVPSTSSSTSSPCRPSPAPCATAAVAGVRRCSPRGVSCSPSSSCSTTARRRSTVRRGCSPAPRWSPWPAATCRGCR